MLFPLLFYIKTVKYQFLSMFDSFRTVCISLCFVCMKCRFDVFRLVLQYKNKKIRKSSVQTGKNNVVLRLFFKNKRKQKDLV